MSRAKCIHGDTNRRASDNRCRICDRERRQQPWQQLIGAQDRRERHRATKLDALLRGAQNIRLDTEGKAKVRHQNHGHKA